MVVHSSLSIDQKPAAVTLASTAAWTQPFFHNHRKAASWLQFIALYRVSFLAEFTSTEYQSVLTQD